VDKKVVLGVLAKTIRFPVRFSPTAKGLAITQHGWLRNGAAPSES